ncbi:hypothetical protein [Kineosporia babensis]|uniref:Uncharacterized protein n=1 Tax=Kineosporia babensis TaxID=499548 RepID=A0A9X1SUC2_9ACTN|nr:hypothetical protein [Kineosporia babensis]MCD5312744.1 hypothetical protein [Kineosporia babensis]
MGKENWPPLPHLGVRRDLPGYAPPPNREFEGMSFGPTLKERFRFFLLTMVVILAVALIFGGRAEEASSESYLCEALTSEKIVSVVGGRVGYDEWSADSCQYRATRTREGTDLKILAVGDGTMTPRQDEIALMERQVEQGEWTFVAGLGDHAVLAEHWAEVQVVDDGRFFSITVMELDSGYSLPVHRELAQELAWRVLGQERQAG